MKRKSFIFLKPGLIWKLTEEWKSYRADEPSEFVGLSNICYTPINKFPQNSLW